MKCRILVFALFFIFLLTGVAFTENKSADTAKGANQSSGSQSQAVSEKDSSTAAKDKEKKKKRDVEADKQEIQLRLKTVSKNISKELDRIKQGAIVRVVVSSFSNNGELAKKKGIGTLIMGELMLNLAKFNNIELVEREKLTKVIDELRLAQLGFTDSKTAAEVGKLLQAQVVITGEVAEAGDKFVINARVVDVETAKVLYQEGFNSPIEGMIALSSESIVLRSKMDSAYRSLILPGWGQFYNGDKLKGGLISLLEAGLFATAAVMHIYGAKKEDDYKKMNCADLGQECIDRVQKLRSEGEDYYKLRNYFIYGGAVVWVLNVMDAYISGKDFDSALKSSENRFTIFRDGLRLSLTF